MGPSKSIGAVTQRRYAAVPFMLVDSINSFRVGLCSLLIFLNYRRHGIIWRVGYDRDVGDAPITWTRSPPDLHQCTWLMRSIDFISEIERSRLIGYLINRGG